MRRVLCFTFFLAILSIQQCSCADLPGISPSPAPEAGGDLGSSSPVAAAPETSSPAPSPAPAPLASLSSPPSPSPADRSPNSAPAPSPVKGDDDTPAANVTEPPAPSPAPALGDAVASDISHESTTAEVNESSSSDGGMDGGKKAGVAVGVMAAACVVGLGAMVYKKRRQNIRRAQFGYAARRDFL